jgi:hypothetical protein
MNPSEIKATASPDSSYTALNWVKDILSDRFPLTTVKIRRPAVVVEFGGGYETGDHPWLF